MKHLLVRIIAINRIHFRNSVAENGSKRVSIKEVIIFIELLIQQGSTAQLKYND